MTDARQPELFDREGVYDEEIAPLMAQILAICKREKIPMLASFLYAREAGEGSEEGEPPTECYCTSVLLWPNEGRGCRTLDLTSQVISRGIGPHEGLRVGSGSIAMTVVTGKET